jgi:hypothetical protein
MKKSVLTIVVAVCVLLGPITLQAAGAAFAADGAIDRHALVTRHNIGWNDPHGEIPLGNGEFCFNVDATGLQTFSGSTLSHWAWHSAPLPPGLTLADVPPTGTMEKGRLRVGMRNHTNHRVLDTMDWGWMFKNPHPINLARLRLIRADGVALEAKDIGNVTRNYNLWTGLHTSRFEVDGQTVTVETCVHPTLDLIAVRAKSPLLCDGKLVVALDFPYPAALGEQWAGDWNRQAAHVSELLPGKSGKDAVIRRTADASTYHASVAWSKGSEFKKWPEPGSRKKELVITNARFGDNDKWVDVTGKVAASVQDNRLDLTPSFDQLGDPLPGRAKNLQVSYTLDGEPKEAEVREGVPLLIQAAVWKHGFMLSAAKDGPLEFACGFSSKTLDALPTVAQTQQAAAEHWKKFWSTGGAIDLSQSKDPRWMELERRIVLSQYQMAAQSAGSWPPAEIGLMGADYWSSQFHMEMVWWHLAHYGLWDRWPMAEKALGCYRKFLPVARQLAGQFDYKGAKWGKQVGPEGRTAPWGDTIFLLQWQQPHPIFFAELEYRLRPTRATLKKWEEVIFETADYMADFPTRDDKGIYNLAPVWAASEDNALGTNMVFETAYWRFGLDKAQEWRERLGLSREPRWDEVRAGLAPVPESNGVYVLSQDHPNIQGTAHADSIGVCGMLPPLKGVDRETAHRTVLKVWKTYDWERSWGWDFPWFAMAAARTGEPALAVDALLHPSSKNAYDRRGVCAGGMPYLPGNGGLLYAVAMMAAGWDGGPERHAPGFPSDGSWVVKREGLKRAP